MKFWSRGFSLKMNGRRVSGFWGLLAACGIWLSSGFPVLAYNFAGSYVFASRWDESSASTSGGVTLYPEEHGGGNEFDVCPSGQLSSMFPALVVPGNIRQTCANLWVALLESDRVLGSSITLTRAKDMSEDWDVNFVDPADPTHNHWFDWYINQYFSASVWATPTVTRSGYPLTLTGGPHAGESVLANTSLLAMGDDKHVFIDPDGSLSFYDYAGGTLKANPTATVFSGGAWAGQALLGKLRHMVGHEQGNLYFVEGASTLHVYNESLVWQRTQTVALGHELAGRTLGDLVDNKVPGYTYIGWDVGPIVVGVTALRPLDHFEVTTTVSEATVGTPLTFTLKACASTDCASVYTRGVSGLLNLSDGTSVPFSIAAGSSTAAVDLTVLARPASGYVTVSLGGLTRSPIGSPSLYCGFGVPAASANGCNLNVVLPFHHLAITSAAASGLTCTPTTFTVTACADATCSGRYTKGLSGNLTLTGAGGTVRPAASLPFAMAAGTSSLALDAQVTVVPAAGHVVLGASGLSAVPTGSPAVQCGLGVAASAVSTCQFPVHAAGFLLSVPDHIAEASAALTVTAVQQGTGTAACTPAFANVNRVVRLTCGHTNPGSGTVPVRIDGQALNAAGDAGQACGAGGANVTLAFDAAGVATAAVRYADVGQLALSASYTGSGADAGLSMAGSASFVVAPAGFAFSEVTAAPLVAGSPFSAVLRARNSLGVDTPNFGRESPGAGDFVRVAWVRREPIGTGASDGAFTGRGISASTPLASADFGAGAVTLNDLAWTEVGKGDLSAELVGGSYLSSGIGVQGSTGASGAVGPFVPHHFDVGVTQACGSFTYSGQPFTVAVSARNAAGQGTVNYDGMGGMVPSHARVVTLSAESNGGTGSLSGGAVAANLFGSGSALLTGVPAFTFTNKLTPATAVSVRATDSNGVSSANGGLEPEVALRSGRIQLSNAFGTGRSSLTLAVQAQHWGGKSWVLNSADGCTSLPASSVALSNQLDAKGAPTSAWATTPSSVVIVGGHGGLLLSAPSPAGTGTIDVAFNLGASGTDKSCLASHPTTVGAGRVWLRSQHGSLNDCAGVTTHDRDPSARATFGVHAPETRKVIDMRDLF